MTPKIRNIILFGGIGLLLVFVYFYFIKSEPDPATSLVVSPATGLPSPSAGAGEPGVASAITAEFLSILLNIKSIKLDDSIFNDPAFLSLTDSSIVLVQDSTEGRPNPFAPIGSDSSSSSQTGTGTQSSGTSGTGR